MFSIVYNYLLGYSPIKSDLSTPWYFILLCVVTSYNILSETYNVAQIVTCPFSFYIKLKFKIFIQILTKVIFFHFIVIIMYIN